MESVLIKGVIIALFSCISLGQETQDLNYYWRDYTGIIPRDAVPGGYDVNHKTTYIGQVHVKGFGVIPAMIYPGQKSVVAAMAGVKTVDSFIRILCSPNLGAFKWIPAGVNDFHLKTINKHVVIGGIEHDYLLFIGRIAYQGELVLGKVVTGSPDTPGQAPMYFVSRNAERQIQSYEVLTYDPSLIYNVDLRRQRK